MSLKTGEVRLREKEAAAFQARSLLQILFG
jgi:hypothetical protein